MKSIEKDTGKAVESSETVAPGGSRNGSERAKDARVKVLKTYKLYIDGKFPRTESGRYIVMKDAGGKSIANICRASRKDFREAMVAARKAQPEWGARSAFNKGQILYRIAEVLEGRKAQFEGELVQAGMDQIAAAN